MWRNTLGIMEDDTREGMQGKLRYIGIKGYNHDIHFRQSQFEQTAMYSSKIPQFSEPYGKYIG